MRTVLLCLTSLTTSLSAQVQPAPDLVGEQLGVVLTTRLRATGELVRLEACAPSVVRALSTALRARLSAPGGGVEAIRIQGSCEEGGGSLFGRGDYRVLRVDSLRSVGAQATFFITSRRLESSHVERFELRASTSSRQWFVSAMQFTHFSLETR